PSGHVIPPGSPPRPDQPHHGINPTPSQRGHGPRTHEVPMHPDAISFVVCPVFRARPPGKTFSTLEAALKYARKAARLPGCCLTVWSHCGGRRLRKVETVDGDNDTSPRPGA